MYANLNRHNVDTQTVRRTERQTDIHKILIVIQNNLIFCIVNLQLYTQILVYFFL